MNRKTIDQLDCALSALLLNCGQFGCCIADSPEHEFAYAHQGWMSKLASVDSAICLRDLAIPGTHDSGTCTIAKSKPFSAVGRTQNCTIKEQLLRGARYLDIRVAGSGSERESLSIYHGALAGAPLAGVLDDIASFITENPGEFLFLEFVQEYGREVTTEQRLYLFDLLLEKLGSRAYTEADWSKLLNSMPLKELADANLSCCIMIHNRILGFESEGTTFDENVILEKYGFFCSNRYAISKWHNTREIDRLLEWNKQELERHGQNRNRLLINQVLLTPGVGGAGDIGRLLVGKASLRPVSFATTLYKRDILDTFVRSNADLPWNVVEMDFLDLVPALIAFLISLNFPAKMEVVKATVGQGNEPTDVTEKIKTLVKRERVLYLTNVQEDLALHSSDGHLIVVYTFDGDATQKKLEVDFDDSTEIVLGQYSQEGAVHVDTE